MRQYEMKELVFQGEVLTKEWASVSLEAVFTNGETTVKAKGFYDGDGVYKVRFSRRNRALELEGDRRGSGTGK